MNCCLIWLEPDISYCQVIVKINDLTDLSYEEQAIIARVKYDIELESNPDNLDDERDT